MKKFIVFFILIYTINGYTQIKVFDNFENGNIEYLFTRENTNTIFLRPSLKTDSNTTRCWYYFGLTGYDTSTITTINIEHTNNIIGANNPVFSYDKKIWHRTKAHTAKNKSKNIHLKLTKDTVFIAAGYPYEYSKMLKYINNLTTNIYIDTFTVGLSEGKLKVPGIIIANSACKPTNLVWAIGRQHAFETTLNYVIEGYVNFLISDTIKSRKLLKTTLLYVVPMVDVDNVFIGASGRMQKPIDFNRDWSNNPHWQIIKKIQQKIITTKNTLNYQIFFDFHSTYPGAYTPIFGIFNEYPENTDKHQNIKLFLKYFYENAGYKIDEIKGYREKKYADVFNMGITNQTVKTSEFSSTIECDWNNNFNGKPLTQNELRNIGALIAETLCDYLNNKEKF